MSYTCSSDNKGDSMSIKQYMIMTNTKLFVHTLYYQNKSVYCNINVYKIKLTYTQYCLQLKRAEDIPLQSINNNIF